MDASSASIHDWTDRRFATEWSAQAEELNPVRREHLDLLLSILLGHDPHVVADLGVGSGLVAERILDALPDTRVIGADASEAMLELARDRLARFGERARLVAVDLAQDFSQWVNEPLDAAIAVQTLHNLAPESHRRVLHATGDVLKPEGILVVADRFSVPSRLFDAFQVVWNQLRVDEGATPEEHEEALRSHGDQPVSLLDELQWLEQAGFTAGCLQCRGNRALLIARMRPASATSQH